MNKKVLKMSVLAMFLLLNLSGVPVTLAATSGSLYATSYYDLGGAPLSYTSGVWWYGHFFVGGEDGSTIHITYVIVNIKYNGGSKDVVHFYVIEEEEGGYWDAYGYHVLWREYTTKRDYTVDSSLNPTLSSMSTGQTANFSIYMNYYLQRRSTYTDSNNIQHSFTYIVGFGVSSRYTGWEIGRDSYYLLYYKWFNYFPWYHEGITRDPYGKSPTILISWT